MDPRDNIPWLYRIPKITHYYGETVRQLFLAAAVLMLVGAPLYAEDIALQGPELVIAAIVLAIVAGVMSPQMRLAKLASIIVSIVGAIIFELWALTGYLATGVPSIAFLIRQAIALVFFLALYLSIKTSSADIDRQLDTESIDEDFDRDREMSKIDHEIGDADDSLVSGNV